MSASMAAPLVMSFGSVYLPGRSLLRRSVTVALASNSLALSTTPALLSSLPISPASAPAGTVTTTAPFGSPWNGWKVALISHSAPPISASASTARMRRGKRWRGAPAGRRSCVLLSVVRGPRGGTGRRGAARWRRGGGGGGAGSRLTGTTGSGVSHATSSSSSTPAGWNSCVACGNGAAGMASGWRSGSGSGSGSSSNQDPSTAGSGSGSGSGRARSTRNGSSLGAAGSGGCALRAENVSGGGAFSPRRAARSAAARARSSGLRSGGVGWRRGTCCVRIVTAEAVGRAEPSALGGREEDGSGLAGLVAHERQLAVDGHHQALRVHVGGLELDRLDVAGLEQRQLLGLLLVDGAVVHRRPHGLDELVLLVADELRERRVELAELAVEREHGHRRRSVVEAVARLARGDLADRALALGAELAQLGTALDGAAAGADATAGGHADDLAEHLGDALVVLLAALDRRLLGTLGLAAGDDRRLAGGGEAGLQLVELGHREGELGVDLLDPLVAGLGALHGRLRLLARHRGFLEDLVRGRAQRGDLGLGGGELLLERGGAPVLGVERVGEVAADRVGGA